MPSCSVQVVSLAEKEGSQVLMRARPAYCDIHKDKPREIELYCYDCSQAICYLCSAVEHKTHLCSDLQKVNHLNSDDDSVTVHTATVHTATVHTDPFTPTTVHTADGSHRRQLTPTTVNTASVHTAIVNTSQSTLMMINTGCIINIFYLSSIQIIGNYNKRQRN